MNIEKDNGNTKKDNVGIYVQSMKIILHLDISWDISKVHEVHLGNL